MANPSGKNSPVSFTGFDQDPPVYGEKQQQGDLQRLAPMAGQSAAASPLNAPKRAGRRATRPTTNAAAPVPMLAASPPALSYPARLAAEWAQLAAEPGASPLVREYAALALRDQQQQ